MFVVPAALLLQPYLSATYAVLGRFLHMVGCKLYAMSFTSRVQADGVSATVGSSPCVRH